MIAVVIDTNAIHRDPWLKNQPGTALLDLADRGKCVLVFPQVVIDELSRQQHDWVHSKRHEVKVLVEKLRGNPVNVDATLDSLEQSINELTSQVKSSFDELITRTGVKVEPVPTDATARLVKRDLARRRPFLEEGSEPWSTGFRDAVIWETILDVLSELPADVRLIFVTADKGFLSDDKKSLHQDLLEDLDARQVAHDRIITAQTTFMANSEVESHVNAATEEDADHAELVRVATDALYALTDQDISLQMVHGGDYDYPEFVKFEVPPMESQEIVAIDQCTEFTFEPEVDGAVTGSAQVRLSIEGATFKGDYLVESEGILELIGELNNHYFETMATIEARAVVEIENCGDTGKYTIKSIALEDL
ncbi:PIN domain-containing protein [Brachybacterium vulturis]|uniref:PIN domain-containing protein n=1 Tax=Brachybacterium vulturis TaxID=2017484 RepID=UPI003735F81E